MMELRRCLLTSRCVPLLAALIAVGMALRPAQAEEGDRKFAVMLAVPIKSLPNPLPPGQQLPSTGAINDHYFDLNKPDVDSYAEYWREISYGNVNVSGATMGWVEVPWPILPKGSPLDLDANAETPASMGPRVLPFADLNNNGTLAATDKFVGEVVDSSLAMINVDWNGDYPGLGLETAPFTLGVTETAGSGAVNAATGEPLWMPGERFYDIDDDGQYDALLEDSRDGFHDERCRQDGNIEGEEVCDGEANGNEIGISTDGDAEWDFPEPFEDFLVIYNQNVINPRFRWIRLDPSMRNTNTGPVTAVGSRLWAEAYIRTNFPGSPADIQKLIDRCGNGKYDPPDFWQEQAAATLGGVAVEPRGSKMQREAGIIPRQFRPSGFTPHPDQLELTETGDPCDPGRDMREWWWGRRFDVCGSGYEFWWSQFVADKFTLAGLEAPAVLPTSPAWPHGQTPTSPNIPNFRLFDSRDATAAGPPDQNTNGGGGGVITVRRGFFPNTGGEFARTAGRSACLAIPGACCFVDATSNVVCQVITAEDCSSNMGFFYGEDVPCAMDTCTMPPPQALCYYDPLPDDNCDMHMLPEAICREDSRGVLFWPGNGLMKEGLFPVIPDENSGTILPDDLDVGGDGFPDMYDGPAEFDDMPSSIYHARRPSGLQRFLVGPPSMTPEGKNNGGDNAFGEVTSPLGTDPWGTDSFAAGGGPSPDGTVAAGGPLAYFVHGTSGFDGGNVLNLEFVTWMNDPSGPTAPAPPIANGEMPEDVPTYVFKRDWNLDGLLDMGEVRQRGTENYVIDSNNGTLNDGGPNWDGYPHNRQRLTEDTVAALDPGVDWDGLFMRGNATFFDLFDDIPGNGEPPPPNFVYGTVLLPPGIVGSGLAAGGRGLFQLPAPAMNLPINIVEAPGTPPISPLFFSDFATAVDGNSEDGLPIANNGYAKELMSHEFLHVWEGYPDLYDYDEYAGGPGGQPVINRPVGIWDIMSGSWCHPNPLLKNGDRPDDEVPWMPHRPWLQTNDLTLVMQPGFNSQVTMMDYAFDPSRSAYYFENPRSNTPPAFPNTERYYFWRPTRLPSEPGRINFNRQLPGNGMMIMHTDQSGDGEGFPSQQRFGSHFTFNIVQADGLHQLEDGTSQGDAGDPFPFPEDSSASPIWGPNTDPSSRWWNNTQSELSIQAVTNLPDRSIVTFLWSPRLVPELRFINPPGGLVVNNRFVINYEAFDVTGGTRIEFFFSRDNTTYAGATMIPPIASKPPGTSLGSHQLPLNLLPGDGLYYMYARLVPGPGNNGATDDLNSAPRAAPNNLGRGAVINPIGDPNAMDFQADTLGVNIANSRYEYWILTCVDESIPGREEWEVTHSPLGQTVAARFPASLTHPRATTQDPNDPPYFSNADPLAAEVSFRINWTGLTGTATVSNENGRFVVTDPNAAFDATNFTPRSTIRLAVPGGGSPPRFNVAVVRNPNQLEISGDASAAVGSNVQYWLHAFTAGGTGNPPDTFTFITTGKTDFSLPVEFRQGQYIPRLYPTITVTYANEMTNPLHRVPVAVTFDGAGTLDEYGNANPNLLFAWTFGDNTSGNGTRVTHTYNNVLTPPATPRVTITNPLTGLQMTVDVAINIAPAIVDPDGDGVDAPLDNCRTVANADQANVDSDAFGDVCDNCPMIANDDQLDTDADMMGDVCDDDDDGDGVNDTTDNCPLLSNANQADADSDGLGDVCETDVDSDGVLDPFDNCPNVSNPSQSNVDGDAEGDACDTDRDNDGVPDATDNCRDITNPQQENFDGDALGDPCDPDDDNDGVFDNGDNCRFVPNNNQANLDNDSLGDVCDDDMDNDTVLNATDNCPMVVNTNQADFDHDGKGDACEDDFDGDGVLDAADNCRQVPNSGQQNVDGDALGDACDPDIDGDGLANAVDNCPSKSNFDQKNLDGDAFGDVCDDDVDGDGAPNISDNCPTLPNANQANLDNDALGDACDDDIDGDLVPNLIDNCKLVANPGQPDKDGDGVGDACESDADGDSVLDPFDNCPARPNADQADADRDGFGDVCDNCPALINVNQADYNGDGVGDACDPTFELIGCPSNVTLVAKTAAGEALFYALPSVLRPSGRARFELSHVPGTVFPIGETTVTITAIAENSGETRSCSFKVTVTPLPTPTPPPGGQPNPPVFPVNPSDPLNPPGSETPPATTGCFPFGFAELFASLAFFGFVAQRRRIRR